MLKTSEFSRLLCTRENSDVFNTLDEIFGIHLKKVNNLYVFIQESCVSDNPIRHERPRTPMNDREYYHGTTRNDPDPATVELRFRPRQQPNTINPDEFKRFKLVVALLWRFPYHQGSSRITTVQLGLMGMSLRCCYDAC